MNKKTMFYGLLTIALAGSASFTDIKDTKVADALTVAASNDSGELVDRSAAEKREENYEAIEARVEADLK